MNRSEKRCLRWVHGQLIETTRDLMWWALNDDAPEGARLELAASLRAIADKMERFDD